MQEIDQTNKTQLVHLLESIIKYINLPYYMIPYGITELSLKCCHKRTNLPQK